MCHILNDFVILRIKNNYLKNISIIIKKLSKFNNKKLFSF